MTLTHDLYADQLNANGYQITLSSVDISTSSVERIHDVQAMRPHRDPVPGAVDFTDPANLAVVTFTYASWAYPDEFSDDAARFADALVRQFPTRTGALIRRTARAVTLVWSLGEGLHEPALYDTSVTSVRPLWPHGLTAQDCSSVLTLSAGCPDISMGESHEWIAGRSPLTVARDALPVWDTDAVSTALMALVEVSDLEPCGRYLEPAPVSAGPATRENLTHPKDRDPFDPIRFIPGAIAKLFARRRELGVEGLDDDQLHAKLTAQREAARGPGAYMPWLD